ncbi:MAG: VirB4 family type IV secretion system protein [Desulfocucumaceae bacterium]
MILGRMKGKKTERSFDKKPPGKDQPDIVLGAGNSKDFIAPSIVKEIIPGDKNALQQRSGDYYVEIGSTAEMARYFRNFYAALTTGYTSAGMLNGLFAGDFGEADCDVAIHVTPTDSERTMWNLEQKIAMKEVAFREEPNPARKQRIIREIQDLQRQHSNLVSGDETILNTAIQVLASATDFEIFKRFCTMLIKSFAGKGIVLRPADGNQLAALLNMTPLDPGRVSYPFRNAEASNLADWFPFGYGGIRHKNGIVIGEDSLGKLVFFNPWHVNNGNYNIVIFGRSGFGKSFLIKLMVARLLVTPIHTQSGPKDVRVAIIDPAPEKEYRNVMYSLGFPHVELSPYSSHRINMFDLYEQEDEDGKVRVNVEETVKAVRAVVFRMIRGYDNRDEILAGNVKIKIEDLIKRLYSDRGISEDTDSLYEPGGPSGKEFLMERQKKGMPVLSDLYDLMKDDTELKKAAEILRTFTKGGGSRSNSIFDCTSNVDISKCQSFTICVADLDEEILRPLGLFIATKWTWEIFGVDRSVPKMIVTDESQLIMDKNVPELAGWLENAFRRARKKNISMCSATQGFEVFLRVEQGLGVLKNSTTKILLKQDSVDIEAVQEKFNLSEGEAACTLLFKKGQGIIKVDNDSALINITHTPREYMMFTSDPNDVVEVLKGAAAGGN